jgi:hypothetical protein
MDSRRYDTHGVDLDTRPLGWLLDHYQLEGRRRAEGHGRLLEPTASPRLESLPLVATKRGRRTLVVGARHLPLYEPGSPPARVVLSIRR